MWQIIINGPGYFDTAYDLPEGSTTLGRADENDVVLSGESVSRRHARLAVNGRLLSVEDLGSRNGSQLNGVTFQGTLTLKSGDVLNVGENVVSIREMVSGHRVASSVRRLNTSENIEKAVIAARNARDSKLLRSIDDGAPFVSSASLEALPSLMVAYESLLLLYKVSEKLLTAQTLQPFLEEVTHRLMQQVGATTGVLLLGPDASIPAVVRHRLALRPGEVPVSDAIVQAALAQGAALAVARATADERFAERESVIQYGASQVLCIPLGESRPYHGVLYLNRTEKGGERLEELLDLGTAVGRLIAAAVERFKSPQEERPEAHMRRVLSQALTPSILEKYLRDFDLGKPLPLETRPVTVLCAELTRFGAVCDALTPERLASFMVEWNGALRESVFAQGGTLEELSGASAKALFGAPYPAGDDTQRAVRTALHLRGAVRRVFGAYGFDEHHGVSVGIHLSDQKVGFVGHGAATRYGSLGEASAICRRMALESAPGEIRVTEDSLLRLGSHFSLEPLADHPVQQGDTKISVFRVKDQSVSEPLGAPS